MAAEGEGMNLACGGWDNPQQQAVQAAPVAAQVEAAQEAQGQGTGQEPEGDKANRGREGGQEVKDDNTQRDLVLVEDEEVVRVEDSEKDIYYNRKRKPSEHSRSVFTPIEAMYPGGHALPDANRNHNLVFGSMSKDLDTIRHRKVQLINFLASLDHGSENSAMGSKSEGGKLIDHSGDPTEQKEKGVIIVIDSDDEDGNNSEYNEMASEMKKDLKTSEVTGKSEGGKLNDDSK